MAVARRPGYLTKTVFSELFGSSREESDAFPHDEVARFPGHMYKYTAIAIEYALPCKVRTRVDRVTSIPSAERR